jgi:hypothetical protein
VSGGATAFVPPSDATSYVPYAGAERALASLEEWACDAERPVLVLRGGEGAGKSTLLAVLAGRVGRHAVPVFLSAQGLDPETLARQVLDALGSPWEGSPRVALARAVEQLGRRRVLLLIDDADALAPRTEMWLFDCVRRSNGALHALLAVRDERLAADLAGAFRSGTQVLAIDAPMARDEVAAWLRAELSRSGAASDLRERFDAAAVERLHARSGGVPGRLRQEFAALAAEAAASAAAAKAAAEPALAEEPAPRLAPPREAAARAEPAPLEPARPAPAALAAPPERPASLATRAPAPARRDPAPARTPLPPRAREALEAAVARKDAEALAMAARSEADPVERPFGGTPRRDTFLRWMLVPAALAVAYVAGFLTSQALEMRRAPGAPAPAVAGEAPQALPPVAAAPPAAESAAPAPVEMRAPDPFEPPAIAAPPPAAPAARADTAAPAAGQEPGPADLAGSARATAERAPAAPSALPDVSTPPPAAGAPVAGRPAGEAPAPVASEPAAVAAAPPPARAARRAAEAPASRMVKVDVEAEPGASILVDGRPVGSGSVQALPLAPGPHRVEVWLPDGRVVERVVEVRGTRYQVKVR